MEQDRKASFLSELHAQNRSVDATQIAHALKRFPENHLYVNELFQNALDAGATSIRIETTSTSLLFEHNGKGENSMISFARFPRSHCL